MGNALSAPVQATDLRRLVGLAQDGDRRRSRLSTCSISTDYSYLHLSVGNRRRRGPDDADLLKMLEAIGRFRWRSAPFSAWLFGSRTTWRWTTSGRRSAGSRRRRCRSPAGPGELGRGGGAPVDRRRAARLIEDLSNEQQQVLTLKFVFNFSNGEATILGPGARSRSTSRPGLLRSESRQASSVLEAGIVGLRVRKTTLFAALTGGRVPSAPCRSRRAARAGGAHRRRGEDDAATLRWSGRRTGPPCSATSARWTTLPASSTGSPARATPRPTGGRSARAADRRPRPRRAPAGACALPGQIRRPAPEGGGGVAGRSLAHPRRAGRCRTTRNRCRPSSSR